jgi:hypothetical protein
MIVQQKQKKGMTMVRRSLSFCALVRSEPQLEIVRLRRRMTSPQAKRFVRYHGQIVFFKNV